MADEVVTQTEEVEIITLPENTDEEYDEVIYVEDNPEEMKKAPATISEYLWRTINYHLKSPEEVEPGKLRDQNGETTDRAVQLCYARGRVASKYIYFNCKYDETERHLFSLDTARNGYQHFEDCGNLSQQQGARFMYGYLAYLVALDEGK
jgi:hypothetical protein